MTKNTDKTISRNDQAAINNTKLKLAGALNMITDLHSDRYPHLTAQERYKLFNEALGCLCDTLDINLDMYDLFQQGEISQEVYEDTTQAEHEQDEPNSVATVADELKDLYALNDSMFTGDPNHAPTYTDGTVIRQQDLADMNMNGLQRIAEMIGIELGE